MDPVGQARSACSACRRSAPATGWALTKDVSAASPKTAGAICRQASQSMQVESTKKSPGTFSGTRFRGFAMTDLPSLHSTAPALSLVPPRPSLNAAPCGDRASDSFLARMKEPVRLVPAADVRRREARLPQNAGRQVAPLPDLTVGGDLPVTGKFAQAGPQVIHRDVHGSGDVARGELLRRAHVQQERTLGRQERPGPPRHRPAGGRPAAARPPRSPPC